MGHFLKLKAPFRLLFQMKYLSFFKIRITYGVVHNSPLFSGFVASTSSTLSMAAGLSICRSSTTQCTCWWYCFLLEMDKNGTFGDFFNARVVAAARPLFRLQGGWPFRRQEDSLDTWSGNIRLFWVTHWKAELFLPIPGASKKILAGFFRHFLWNILLNTRKFYDL